MNMKQCEKGHYYDISKNASCPYCNSEGEAGVTRPLNTGGEENFTQNNANAESAFPKTAPIGVYDAQTPIPPTMPLYNSETNKTVALNINEQGIDPVRGWLVCISGNKKGKDFRIHSEKNFIGRAKSNDICIDFDDVISREGHAVITYDIRKNKFWLQSGDGKSNIYVNDDIVLVPIELKSYDTISIGNTKFSFIPFCSDAFIW